MQRKLLVNFRRVFSRGLLLQRCMLLTWCNYSMKLALAIESQRLLLACSNKHA